MVKDNSHGTTDEKLLKLYFQQILNIGFPRQYVLGPIYETKIILESAAKHLLSVQGISVSSEFADLLQTYVDICPAKLPFTVPPYHGIEDVSKN